MATTETKTARERVDIKDDVWIPSACSLCYSRCPIKVHRVNGVVVKIEGNPDTPVNQGRLCPRGASGIMLLYDPNRVNVPMKRTNPEKGIGVDPKWVEITWDEALDTITEKLKKLQKTNPRGVLVSSSVVVAGGGMAVNNAFINAALGAANYWVSGAGPHCGNAEHLFGGLLHGAWCKWPDPLHCNYILNFGTPVGAGAYYTVSGMTRMMADARARGMKQVVIEPYMGMAGEKADEWVPIRPGTDAAMALAMVNVMLNELGIYDREYLREHTNGPYLIGPDGRYVRDRDSRKPLVWDAHEGRAKTYDDPTVKEFALEGEYEAEGVRARTAFSLLKEHVKRYTPESVTDLTTVPAATIRRLAKEFGENARIGSKIVLEGKEMPYRPVAVMYFKGAQGHKNATLNSMAMELLGEIVGASNVPGGLLGHNSRSFGYPGTGRPAWSPSQGLDGLMSPGMWSTNVAKKPYPPAEGRKPETYGMLDMIPTGVGMSPMIPLALLDPEKYKLPYKIEFHFHFASNYLMTLADPNLVARAFKDIFTASFSLFLDESTDLSDIVLPDACYLERVDPSPDLWFNGLPVQEWAYHVAQPVVEPMYQRRPSNEVILELAERMGVLPEMYSVLNMTQLSDPYKLDPSKRYTLEDFVDRRFKSLFGEEHGWEWFKEHGVIRWPKKVEEVYWKAFIKARVPIYFEFFPKIAEDIERVKKEHGIEGFPTNQFQPLPDWNPCPSHEEKRPDYDLWAFYFRMPFQTFTSTGNNAWLDEVSRMDPYAYYLVINEDTATKKGIKDGDWVELESHSTGGKVQAIARLSQGIHPEAVGLSGFGGHWSKHLPIASQKGKGANFEWLLPLDFEHMDVPAMNMDICTKVKISRVQA